MKPARILTPLLLLGISSAQAIPEIIPRPSGVVDTHSPPERVLILPAEPNLEPVRPNLSRDNVQVIHQLPAIHSIDTLRSEIGASPPDIDPPEEISLNAYHQAVNQAIGAFDAGNYALSADILKALQPRIRDQADVGLMLVLGYAAMHTDQEALAVQSMREAVALADDATSRSALIDVLVHFQRYDEAVAVLQELPPSPERERRQREIVVSQAWIAHEAGQHEQVLALLAPYRANPTADERKLISWAQDKLSPQPTSPSSGTPRERYDRLAQTAIQAFENEEYAASVQILQTLWPQILEFGDVGMMVLLGYAAMHSDQETLAIQAMTEAAELTEDDAFYQSLVDVLRHFQRFEEATEVIIRMSPSPERDAQLADLVLVQAVQAREAGDYDTAHALLLAHEDILSPDGQELLGWQFYEREQFDQAAARFEAAYRKAPTESRAQGLVFTLHQQQQYAQLLTIVQETEGPLDRLLDEDVRLRIAAGHRYFSVDGEARLKAVSMLAGSPQLGFSLRLSPEVREKRGTPGEDRLSQRGLLLQAQWQDASNSVHLEVERQRADNKRQQATGQRLYGLWRHRFDQGIETQLGLGRTLSGGAISPALIGEIGLAYHQADHGIGLRAFRRPNQESLLAISGQLDPLTDNAWGRVVETGLQLDSRSNLNEWSLIGSLTASKLTGDGVRDNRKVELYAQALRPVPRINGLRLGPELYAARFQHNLSAFEPGHGGYFSPKLHIKPGLLAEYNTRLANRVDIEARTGLGWSWNHQAAADGNPITGKQPGKYAATRDNGLAYHGQLQAIWNITPTWQLGLHASGQKGPEYTDWRGGFFIQRHWGN